MEDFARSLDEFDLPRADDGLVHSCHRTTYGDLTDTLYFATGLLDAYIMDKNFAPRTLHPTGVIPLSNDELFQVRKLQNAVMDLGRSMHKRDPQWWLARKAYVDGNPQLFSDEERDFEERICHVCERCADNDYAYKPRYAKPDILTQTY